MSAMKYLHSEDIKERVSYVPHTFVLMLVAVDGSLAFFEVSARWGEYGGATRETLPFMSFSSSDDCSIRDDGAKQYALEPIRSSR